MMSTAWDRLFVDHTYLSELNDHGYACVPRINNSSGSRDLGQLTGLTIIIS